MLPLLRALAFIPIVIAARLRGIERRVIERLRAAGANTSERAILLEQGKGLSTFVYRRLSNERALVAAGNDRYYLDEGAYDRFGARRRRRAHLVLIAVVVFAVVLLYVKGAFS
jgi:hypothetical protein